MDRYVSANGIYVFASTPEKANKEFCQIAYGRGLVLIQADKYNPDTGQFNNSGKRFFMHNSFTKVICNPEEILLLPLQPEQIGVPYTALDSENFKRWYKPVSNSTPEPETPSNKTALAGKYFFLDAGHGGTDSGAINDNLGLQEKIAALDICLKLGIELEKQGAQVYYSRTGDTYPSLTTRANQANKRNVTAFISIHLNSADNKTAQGIETLVYSLKGTAFELAEIVQKNMVAATGWTNRGVKARPELTVLKKTIMPAILCEVGFISNDNQARELFKPEIQDKLANAIASGIVEKFGK